MILSIVPRAFFPVLRGGLELTARETLGMLRQIRPRVALAARCQDEGIPFLAARLRRKLLGPYARCYRFDGFAVHVDPYHPGDIGLLADRLQPSLLVCHVAGDDDLVRNVARLGLPTLFYVHEGRVSPALAEAARMRVCRFAAESTYVRQRVAAAVGHEVALLRPLLGLRANAVGSGAQVLVVNPHPAKGGALVVDIARRLPDRRFLVVGGWEHTRGDPEVRRIEAALMGLHNVHRIPYESDMGAAFARSRILLMPCLVDEAFGRAAAEALLAGVPVLASDRGALPETVGAGGEVLPVDAPLEQWIDAVERCFIDEAHHAHLRHQALAQAGEPNRQPGHVRAELARLIGELIPSPHCD